MLNIMQTIPSNITNLISRLILLILVVSLLCLLHQLMQVNNQQAIAGLYFLLILFAFLIIIVCISFFGVIKVEINKLDGIITFSRIFSKKSVLKNEITGYYNTFSISKRRIFYGLLIKLENGESVDVNEYNVKSIKEIEQYLAELNIASLGKLRLRFPFKTNT